MPNIRQIQQNEVPLSVEWKGIELHFTYRPGMFNQEFEDDVNSKDEPRARAAFARIIKSWDLTETNEQTGQEQMVKITAEAFDIVPSVMRGMIFSAIAKDIAGDDDNTLPNSDDSRPTLSVVESSGTAPTGTSG